jgi:hypothetical protein
MFYSDTFPQIIQSLSLPRGENAIRFRHWSSRATPGTTATVLLKFNIYDRNLLLCMSVIAAAADDDND